MIDCKKFFDQPMNSNFKTYENIRKIATGQGDDHMTGCLLGYSFFKDHYKMIATDFSKHKLLMPIQEQFKKLILQQIQIEQEIQQCYLLLKKQKKLF